MKKLLVILVLGLFSCQKEELKDCSRYEMEYETAFEIYMSYKIMYEANPTNSNKYHMMKSKEERDEALKNWDVCQYGY